MFDNIKTQRKEERERKLREQLEEQIICAEQVRNFFETDLGKYLEAKMAEDQQTIKNKLITVDFDDEKQIRKLQNSYEVIAKIKFYLGHALLTGDSAEKALNLHQFNDLNNYE
jgi:hypothetical protein